MGNKSSIPVFVAGAVIGVVGSIAAAVAAADAQAKAANQNMESGIISDPDKVTNNFSSRVLKEVSKFNEDGAKILKGMERERRNLIRARKSEPPTMMVSGSGYVMAHPDLFRVSCSVVTILPVKGEAVAAHDKALDKVSKFLLEDLQLNENFCTIRGNQVSEFNRAPKNKEPDIQYRCETDFTITLESEEALLKLLVGANDIALSNVYVRAEVKDVSTYKRTAYKRALDDALLKAATMMEDYDQDIIGIRSISEASNGMYHRGSVSPMDMYSDTEAVSADQSASNLSKLSVEDVRVSANLDVVLDLSEARR